MFGNLPLCVMQFPSKKWGYVGSIPTVLGEAVKADTPAVMGQRAWFGPDGGLLMWKFPAFELAEEAVAFAASKGIEVKLSSYAVRYADGKIRELNQGAKIRANGYEGAYVRHYDGQMIEVRLPGGVCCMDAGGVEVVE